MLPGVPNYVHLFAKTLTPPSRMWISSFDYAESAVVVKLAIGGLLSLMAVWASDFEGSHVVPGVSAAMTMNTDFTCITRNNTSECCRRARYATQPWH